MTRGEEGLWSVTVGPLEPDLYSYHFLVDGALTIDPKNRGIKGRTLASMVRVPGVNLASLHAWRDVAHGIVHRHSFTGDRFTALHAGLHASCLPVGC